MPELPEVETIRQYLRQGKPDSPSILGKEIRAVQVLWDRTIAAPAVEAFKARLRGQKIQEISRRGKFMLFELEPDTLLIHLRMSGDLWVEPGDREIAPHHRLILNFADGTRLAFNDPRKFGRAWLTADAQEVVGGLGPEPLDEQFTAADLHVRLHNRRRLLKPLLMDQAFIAGLGNIYTDEALHRAGLHPLARSHQVTPEQSQALRESIQY
ncbi:MAG TPA: DNA-formamidopyrimidine glycosylase, partial [Anaerolineales bacterium]|nr:DNA-formamidopyrimidine glycosylase [Anaerolineales bacterium]